MKIAIDISPLTRQKKTGIENYVFNLCKNLPLIDKKNEYILFANSYGHYQQLQKAVEEIGVSNYQNMSMKVSKVPGSVLKLMWKYLSVPSSEQMIGNIDIFHATDRLDMPLKKSKLVVTIFDMIPLIFKEFLTKDAARYFKDYFDRVIPMADMIISISYCTKTDILKYFDIPEEKVKVIPLAASVNYKRIQEKGLIEKVKNRYGINKKYLLYVGVLDPRKNLINLIKAYNDLPVHTKRDYQLLLCGKKSWYYEEIIRTVRELHLEEKVIFTGYIPEKNMSILLNAAEIFVYPSFYEGFGLPPLEAMACGTPVITSNTSSIPEVVGDAGILVNPDNVAELSDAIFKVLSDESLKIQLSEKSVIQAKKFSWEMTARKTVEVYNQIGNT